MTSTQRPLNIGGLSVPSVEVLLLALDALDRDLDFSFSPEHERDRKRADRVRKQIKAALDARAERSRMLREVEACKRGDAAA